MIHGVGIDIIEVDRVTEKISKEKGFRELVFSQGEIVYCESKAHKFEHYAARFAAKEAFLKAIGTGWFGNVAFNEIEVINDELGKPTIQLLGNTKTFLENKNISRISLSMSHLKSVASAVVIIE
jgi:holo-[acyl-carrier protein] synthase